MIQFLLILLQVITVFASQKCPRPPAPKNSYSTSLGPFYPGNIIQYKCVIGYFFSDGESTRYTKCIYNKETHQTLWTVNRYLDRCYEYCDNCGDWGRCVFSFIERRFKCKCPEHFDGERCERLVCVKPGSIANGTVDDHYRLTENGKVPISTQVRYSCNLGYKLLGSSTVACTHTGLYYPNPPRCVPVKSHDIRCLNEFHRKWPASEPPSMFRYPSLSSNRSWYDPGETISLHCPDKTKMVISKQDPKTLTCLPSGRWSDTWSLCKVNVCKWPLFPRGTVSMFGSGVSMIVPGSTIKFQCNQPYYMFGNKYATCNGYGLWNAIPECVTLQLFKNKCIYAGLKVEFQGYNKSEPVCVMTKEVQDEAAKKQLKTITVVTSTAAVIFGILLIIVAGVAFQRRRLLSQIRRLQQSEIEDRDPTNLDNDVYGQFILPSYNQSQKDKPNTLPPSFEEVLREGPVGDEEGEQGQQVGAVALAYMPTDPAPPPYSTREPYTSVSTIDSLSSSEENDNGVYLDDVMLL